MKNVQALLIVLLCAGKTAHAQLQPEAEPIIVNNTEYDIYTTAGRPKPPLSGTMLYYLYDNDRDGEFDSLKTAPDKAAPRDAKVLRFGCSTKVRIQVRKEVKAGRRYLYVEKETTGPKAHDVMRIDR